MRDLNPRLPVNKTDTLPAELMVPILKKYWEKIWTMRDLNPRLPVNKTDTLPAELMVPILKKYWENIC